MKLGRLRTRERPWQPVAEVPKLRLPTRARLSVFRTLRAARVSKRFYHGLLAEQTAEKG